MLVAENILKRTHVLIPLLRVTNAAVTNKVIHHIMNNAKILPSSSGECLYPLNQP